MGGGEGENSAVDDWCVKKRIPGEIERLFKDLGHSFRSLCENWNSEVF